MKRALAALAVITLAACGGGDEAEFDAGPVTLAEPGSMLAVGDRAFVEYAGLGAEMEPTVNTTLGVT